MVQLFMKIPGEVSNCPEWVIVELQGDLETKSQSTSISGKFIGDLHFAKHKGNPTLIIGHHILQGKTVTLEKPIAVLVKTGLSERPNTSTSSANVSMETDSLEEDAHYIVKAIIKQKLHFKTRPKPIIAHVPKKI